MSVENESLISRWSRRKQLVAEEAANDKKNASGKIIDEKQIVDPEILREEKLAQLNTLTDADMPDLETLDESSDYSGFMSSGVSESLRKMALRKLFQGQTYSFRDGLDDYDGDYTSFAKLDPATITSDMRHMIAVEAKRQLAKEEEEQRRLLAESSDYESNVEEIDDYDATEAMDDESSEETIIADTSVDAGLEINKELKENDNSNNEEVA